MIYDQLGSQLSRPNAVTFSRVNVEQQKHIAQSYNVAKYVGGSIMLWETED